MPTVTRISELANSIAADTSVVDAYFDSHGLPTPSLDVDGPATLQILPSEVEILAAKDRVIANTLELHHLMRGPVESVVGTSVSRSK